MKKLDKVLILIIVELALAAALISLSTVSKMFVAIFLPPVMAVTLFALMISIVDMNTKQLKTAYFIFALFLVGISLFSTGIGFHYASDEINESFFPYKAGFSLDDLFFTKEKMYFLDELFSHWLMIAGTVGFLLGLFFWWYYFKKKALPSIEAKTEDSLLTIFVPIFLGAILGGLMGFGSIEGQLTTYALIISVAVLPFVIYKIRKVKVTKDNITFLSLFIITALGAYIGVLIAFIITHRAYPNI
ncbi:hypothetical protein KY328_00150 [Candidatus Woesearchaeota archaeon]|nr:hypothetical protein [Candidatus Woesearchaeota archaeon]MBW3021310.1 hypothetical protein [Candidatus Woesearchaeota archaeon]